MTWTSQDTPSQTWRVQGVTARRITEAVLLRRTEQGDIRIVYRAGTQVWTATIPVLPPAGWAFDDGGMQSWSTEASPSTVWSAADA